ncbi:MAG: ribokinase [Deltaproteobacteria bacterium]|nr:ribokinase [Deltaproteobacteria bacterium]
MKHIAVVGSLNVDSVVGLARFPGPGETVVGRDHNLFPGGKGANQAFAAGRLLMNTDVHVRMLGQVGGDAHADWLRQNLAQVGVNTDGVLVDAAVSSGVAIIGIEDGGQNRIIVVPGANGTFNPQRFASVHALLDDAAFVLLQLEVPLETVHAAARKARACGAAVILDPAPATALPASLLGATDFVTPNESELRTLLNQAPSEAPLTLSQAQAGAQALLQQGARNVLVKMGGQGAANWGEAGHFHWPAFDVNPVDTTAAGDAFNAGLAAALAQGQTLATAGRFACATAAMAVTRKGAQPAMPTRQEVEALMRT